MQSLQYRKLIRHNSENAEVWIRRLRTAAKECNTQNLDRWVKEQFIHGINDDNMLIEISSEPTAMNIQAKLQVIGSLCGQCELRPKGHTQQPGASQKGISK